MHDKRHVGLINSHAKGIGCNHNRLCIKQKCFLIGCPFCLQKSGMIPSCWKALLTKSVAEFFHGFSCQTIDNPTLSPPFLQQFQQFPFLVARSSDSKIQVFSVETCCNLKRVLQLQQAANIFANLLGCSSCKGTDDRTLL